MKQIESFFWGIIAALGALVVQLLLYIGYSAYIQPENSDVSFGQLFAIPIFIIIGASMEELFKYIVISKPIETFSQEKSYIINSLFVGLGFFATELMLISLSLKNFEISVLGEIAIIHLGTAGMIGYAVATRNPKKFSALLFAIVPATILHASYNLLIVQNNYILNHAVIFILALLVLLNLFNLLRISGKLASLDA